MFTTSVRIYYFELHIVGQLQCWYLLHFFSVVVVVVYNKQLDSPFTSIKQNFANFLYFFFLLLFLFFLILFSSIFQCSVLLPLRFALRETARVCIPCHQRLEPVQPMLQRLKALKHRPNKKYNPDNDQYRSQLNFPIKHTLSGEVRKAAYSVRNLFNPATLQDQSIPASLLKDAKGILFMTVVKVGFLASVRVGTGLVIAKLPTGQWSAPSAVFTGGFGFGAQAGSNITDFVTVLMTNESVRQFAGDTIGIIGASAAVAVGAGRSAGANANVQSNGNTAATYTYSQARGLYAGVAIELGGIKTRHSVNQKFYGRDITPLEILSGREPPPIAAAPLYVELRNAGHCWGSASTTGMSPALVQGEQKDENQLHRGLNDSIRSDKPQEKYGDAIDGSFQDTDF